VVAHAEARKLAALAELIRRFPSGAKMASGGEMPAGWEFGLAEQAGLELSISPGSADNDLAHAWQLAVRLPRTLAALRDGVLDASKARMIARETVVLSDDDAREAERRLAEGWAGKTWSQLAARLSRIVVNIDPDAARRRRERAQREDARVSFWRAASGAAGLAGHELPPDEALQAHARVQARALGYKKAGIEGSMDLLRARAFLDILNGTDARHQQPAHDDATPNDPASDQDTRDRDDCGRSDGQDGTKMTGGDDHDGMDETGGDETGGDETGGDGGPGFGGPGGGIGGAGRKGEDEYGEGIVANLDLTLPLATLLDLGERAGEAGQLGTVDPALVRDLAAAAVRSRKTTIRIIITAPDGTAAGFGIARERRQRDTRRGNPPPPVPPAPAWPAGQPAAPSARAGTGEGFTFGPAPSQQMLPLDGPDLVSGWGTWRLTAAGRQWDIELIAIPAPGPCAHEYRTGKHDPGPALRSLVQIRDGRCALPVCSRPARGTEWEHAIPWPAEPGTCACNGGLHCKRHHRVKDQARDWTIEQLADGRRRWTTPTGLTYTSHHRQYPD
jgi:hypothetical protein